MSFDIGVNVVEVDGVGAPSITGAAVSIGAFNVLTRRGVPNQPQRVTSFPQFVERFGGHFPGGYGAYLVKGFFDNGGQTAYVNRVIDPTPGTGTSAASRTLQDENATDTLTLEGGFRGQEDPGEWARTLFIRVTHSSSAQTRLREDTPASITGSALGATVDMSAFPTLTVVVDGGPPTDLTFSAADFANPLAATREEIRDAINGQTNLLMAAINAGNQPVLTSTGEHARVTDDWTSLALPNANATLGFPAAVPPVLGTPAALNAGGTELARVMDLTVGDAIIVTDGTTTDTAKLLTIDETTGAVTWAPNLPNFAAFTDLHAITVSNAEFDLTIANEVGDDEHVVATRTGLSMEPDLATYAPRALNHPLSGSRWVRAIDEGSASPAGEGRPAETGGFVPLQGGANGTPTANHFIGDAASKTGFNAFDPFNVQLVCCERTDSAIARAALAYCAGREDAMFVGAVPEGFVEAGQAVAYGQDLQAKKAYGALYGPWIIVTDPIGAGADPRITIPPVGHVMGVYARIEATRGIWKAPAGDEANLLNVLDVTSRLSSADHTDLVVNGAVNGIRAIAGSGIVVDASRTLSSDPRWRYVNVRLLFNFVKSSLRMGLGFARQEPNRDFLWNAIKFGSVTPFLMGLWRQGAFGTGTPEETFTVIVDETNNPPDQVEQGRLTVEVYFYPSRPAETIVIIVGQQPSGSTASEA
jgi:hypothetical protein